MSLAFGSEPPWGFVEWGITGLTTLALSASAFVWRVITRLDRVSSSVVWQKAELGAVKQANEALALRVAERLAQLHEEHCRLREVTAALPTRADLHEMEERIGERIEALAARLDRAIGIRGA
jgi:hypothetical protein